MIQQQIKITCDSKNCPSRLTASTRSRATAWMQAKALGWTLKDDKHYCSIWCKRKGTLR